MEDDQEELSSKPHLVIVGGGWGVRTSIALFLYDIDITLSAVGILNSLSHVDYHVTLVSPEMFNTFTALLPCKHATRRPLLSN